LSVLRKARKDISDQISATRKQEEEEGYRRAGLSDGEAAEKRLKSQKLKVERKRRIREGQHRGALTGSR
jgi:hypothetical protein